MLGMARSTDDEAERVRIGERLRLWRKGAGLSQEQAGSDVRDVLADGDEGQADFRGVAPFYLVLHPAVPVDPALRAEVEKAIADYNQRAQKRALRRSKDGPATHPQKPG